MAKNLDSTSPPWWTLAQMLVWILQQVEIPPQDAEQFCNELNPKIIEGALNALTRALFNAIYGAVEGMPIGIARVLCGPRYVDLAALLQPPPSLESSALDALRYDLRQLIKQPGVEFNPVWGKRTWPARVPAATRSTESAVTDEAEPPPSSKVGSEESQPPNKPDSADASTQAASARIINVGYDPDIVRALTHTLKRARPAHAVGASIVAEIVESLSDASTPAEAPNSAKPPTPEKLKDFVAAYIKDAKTSGKVPTKRGLWDAAQTALPGATRTRLHGEYKKQTPTLSPGRPRKKHK